MAAGTNVSRCSFVRTSAAGASGGEGWHCKGDALWEQTAPAAVRIKPSWPGWLPTCRTTWQLQDFANASLSADNKVVSGNSAKLPSMNDWVDAHEAFVREVSAKHGQPSGVATASLLRCRASHSAAHSCMRMAPCGRSWAKRPARQAALPSLACCRSPRPTLAPSSSTSCSRWSSRCVRSGDFGSIDFAAEIPA